jgi:hypothetical protein
MNQLSHGQDIALRMHLSDYPDDASFEQVLMMLEDDENDEVGIWYPFEEWDTEAFIDHLTKLSNAIDAAVIESKNEG